jgi:glutathione synthase
MLLRASPLQPGVLAFAAMARELGVRVVNDPDGILRVTHKSWLASRPGARVPPSVVTRSKAAGRLFYATQPDGVVVKPARGSGGKGVERLEPRREQAFEDAFAAAMEAGDGYVVVQRYLPEAEDGEKRLVWLDGEVLGGYLRRRAAGEFRHNLKRGATAEPTDVTAADRRVAQSVSQALLDSGIRLAGLDIIGDWLIEVNVMNPGGAYHADRLTGSRLADQILTRLCRPLEHESQWVHRVP